MRSSTLENEVKIALVANRELILGDFLKAIAGIKALCTIALRPDTDIQRSKSLIREPA